MQRYIGTGQCRTISTSGGGNTPLTMSKIEQCMVNFVN
jgi:hypothetical protein